MCKQIKCPKFLNQTKSLFCYINCTNNKKNIHDFKNNYRARFQNKDERRKYLLKHCCDDFKNCAYYQMLEMEECKHE